MMSTRWIMLGFQGFTVAAVAALAFALLGPMPLVRTLGWTGLALSTLGTLWHAFLLRRHDPHAWSVLRYRVQTAVDRVGLRWTRARHVWAHGPRVVKAASP